MKQTIIDKVETDIKVLQHLTTTIRVDDFNPELCKIAAKKAESIRVTLETLCKEEERENADAEPPSTPILLKTIPTDNEPTPQSEEEIAPVLNAIQSSIRDFICLNDKFRFSRELFNGDTDRMNDIIDKLDQQMSYENALDFFNTLFMPDEENETLIDFLELIRRRFLK